MVDAGYDFAFFSVGVGSDGEVQAFSGCMDGFGSCMRERDGRWVDIGFGLGVDEVGTSGKCKSSYLVLMCLETFFKSLLR